MPALIRIVGIRNELDYLRCQSNFCSISSHFFVSDAAFADHCRKKCSRKTFGVKYTDEACVIACEAEHRTGLQLPDLGKPIQDKFCDAAISQYLELVKGYCANNSGRMGRRIGINEAKTILQAMRTFSESDFNGVKVRFCKLRGFAGGMVPDKDLILLDDSFEFSAGVDITPILAHEMKHVLQYRKWGRRGFRCRYGKQMIAGNGTGRGNSVEAPAYQLEDDVARKLYEASALFLPVGQIRRMKCSEGCSCGAGNSAYIVNRGGAIFFKNECSNSSEVFADHIGSGVFRINNWNTVLAVPTYSDVKFSNGTIWQD